MGRKSVKSRDMPEPRQCSMFGVKVGTGRDGKDCRFNVLCVFSKSGQPQGEVTCAGFPGYWAGATRGILSSIESLHALHGVEEISIPKSVRELQARCLANCSKLRRVTFGASSSVERIGTEWIASPHVTEVRIPDSVRELCERCFSKCQNLSRVIFGPESSLESIGAGWITGTKVREVNLPDRVGELCDLCFYGSNYLGSVTFSSSASVERIGFKAFSGKITEDESETTIIEEFYVPDSVRELADKCFHECECLLRVSFGPNSCLERIGVEAFSSEEWGCSCRIDEVTLPNSVRELGDRCFARCNWLSRVTIGRSSSLERIGAMWITETRVSEVHIPNGVVELCDRCFYKCESLCRVTFGSSSSLRRIGVEAFAGSRDGWRSCKIEELRLPSSVREICDWCFYGCKQLRVVTFGSSLERIGSHCFAATGLSHLEIPESVKVIGPGAFNECPLSDGLVCKDDDHFRICDGLVVANGSCCCSFGLLSSITIPDGVRDIRDRCFYGCENLCQVHFSPSSSVERLGVEWITSTKVSEVNIPDSVREVCDRCFHECRKLDRITFGSSSLVARIGVDAFKGALDEAPNYFRHRVDQTPRQETIISVHIPDNVRELCDRCFFLCKGIHYFTFGPSSSLERIGTEVLRLSAITELNIPDSVRELCDECFCWCTSLARVTFGPASRLERIGAKWIDGTKVSEVSIPNSVRELRDRCFVGGKALRSVTFGSSCSVEHIGVEAFAIGSDLLGFGFGRDREDSIVQLNIPDSVRVLGARCFYRCKSLRRVTFGRSSSVERLGTEWISGTHVQEVNIPDSVRELCDRCFFEAEELRRVTFGSASSLQRIGIKAFSGQMTCDMNTSCLIEAIAIPNSVRELCDQCFYGCETLVSVTFGPSSSLERIGVEAFSGKVRRRYTRACRLTEISIPDSVREIGQRCFFGCEKLSRVTFGTSSRLEWLGAEWIMLTDVMEVSIPDSVRVLCDRCFLGCLGLVSVKFGPSSSLERIGAEWIKHTEVTEVRIPNSVCELSDGCFYGCKSLRSVTFGPSSSLESLGVEWLKRTQVNAVSIPDGVRELREKCFYGCESLRSVTFGPSSSLVRIGAESLSDTGVTELNIPDSVHELCHKCFYGCANLCRVTFGPSSCLERIGSQVICGTQVSEMNIPDSVYELCDQCFYNCQGLQRVTFGPSSSLELIGTEWIGGTQVSEVTLPDRVRCLCDRCFYGCKKLQSVGFGPSSSLELIGANCFTGTSLVCFKLPSSVRFIGSAAFHECVLRDGLICSDDCYLRVSDGLIISNDFMSCYGGFGALSSILIPDSVHELCDRCFYGCKSLHHVRFGPSSSVERIGVEAFSGPMPQSFGSFSRRKEQTSRCCSITEITLPDSVRELCDRCFAGCESLLSITFGPSSSLERIGAEWIKDTAVREVTIPDTVRELSDKCFHECKSLRSVTFGPSSSLESLGVEWLKGTQVNAVSIPDGVRELREKCFYGCESLRSVTFGPSSSLVRIGAESLRDTAVTELNIPDSVRELCHKCFYGCANLCRVTFGPSSCLEHLGAEAFSDDANSGDHRMLGEGGGRRRREIYGIVEITIPNGLREICDRCFYGCERLRHVTFGSSIERIGTEAFSGPLHGTKFSACGIVEISIPDSVLELCDRCFCGCGSLCRVTFGSTSSVQRIGVQWISDTQVTEVSIPDRVLELCDRCFYNCGSLCRVTFSSTPSIWRIGVEAFAGASGASNKACRIEEFKIPDTVRELCDRCFYGCKCLHHVTVGSSSSLERIGMNCFTETGLVDIEIPMSVTTIGGGAFGESNLRNGLIFKDDAHFRVASGLVFANDFMSCYCSFGTLTSIIIPDNVRELCDRCFYGCKSLGHLQFRSSTSVERIGVEWITGTRVQEVNIPDSVREVCDRCFFDCMSLSRVTFGSSVTVRRDASPGLLDDNPCVTGSSSLVARIGVRAFSGQKLGCVIEEIIIPDNVRELCDQCFYENRKLRRVTFGSSPCVERIGVEAFAGEFSKEWSSLCGLQEIDIPDSVRELGDRCFYGRYSLRHVRFGSSSSLERIGTEWIGGTQVSEVTLPDRVRCLCDRCFYGCKKLQSVGFGPSSSLELIGANCFTGTSLVCFKLPSSVRFIGSAAFHECVLRDGLICSDDCYLRVSDGLIISNDFMSCYGGFGTLSSILIPDSVHELCDRCFYMCKSLHHVRFGPSSSVERIGVEWITGTQVHEVNIPDNVREVCGRCFFECDNLSLVTFGSSSSVARICVEAFTIKLNKSNHPIYSRLTPTRGYISKKDASCEYTIVALHIPDSVTELCDRCFYGCKGLRRVTFGPASSLERLGAQWITATLVSEVAIPDGVCDICDRCFFGCRELSRITFSPSSCVERIGFEAFSGEGVEQAACGLTIVSIPDSVRELCDRCFYGCWLLSGVRFGPSSRLERIGAEAFKWTPLGVTDEEYLTPTPD